MQFKTIIGLVISLVLVVALIFSVDWPNVWLAMEAMRLWPLIPAVILFVIQYIVRALRWRILLPNGDTIKTRPLFDAIMVGSLANFLLPLRAGEFIRPFLLTRYASLTFPSSLVSVIVERFFDLALVLGLFAIVTFITPGVPPEVNFGAAALSGIALGIFAVIILGSFMEERLLQIVDYVCRFIPEKLAAPIKKFSKDFLEGAAMLKTPSRVLLVIGYTCLVWMLIIALNWVFFMLFDISPSLEAVIATTVITALAVAAPSAPGFIGVYQWACIASFALFAFPNEKAVAFSIITHIFNFAGFIIFGGLVLWRDGLKLADLKPKK